MANTIAKKMTSGQLAHILSNYSKRELQDLLGSLYKDCPDASTYLNIRLGDGSYEAALLSEYKEKVYSGFFSRTGKGKLAFASAKEAVRDFENVCRNLLSVLDLQLYFVENAVQLAVEYHNFPAAFYRDTESMFRSFMKTLTKDSNPELMGAFDARLKKLHISSIGADGGLHDSLLHISRELLPTQVSSDKARDTQIPASKNPSAVSPQKWTTSSRETAGETLSIEDAALFFKLFYPLLDFVNKQKNIDDFDSIADAKAAGEDIPESLLSKASLILWQEPDLIDEYLIEKGDLLGDEEKEIVSSWKNAVIGRFVLERHLKKGSIFLSGEDNRVFLVRGLTTTWEEMFPFRPLPILLSTTLIPFRDVIVTDGIVYPHSVIIGSTMAKDFKEQYMTAKRQGAVIDALV